MAHNNIINDLDVNMDVTFSDVDSCYSDNCGDYVQDNHHNTEQLIDVNNDKLQVDSSSNIKHTSLNNYKDYQNMGLIGFSCMINQKYNKNSQKYKKDLSLRTGWNKLTHWDVNINDNALCLLTGIKNNIFVVDIDDVPSWTRLLNTLQQEEPKTVKSSSGSGGLHLYFKYTGKISHLKTSDKTITHNNEIFDIDIRTNGGMIIIPPTTYYNQNSRKYVSYKWINSIFDNELLELPNWLYNLFKQDNRQITQVNNTVVNTDLNDILNNLSIDRCNNYSDWINVGMALYNIDINNYKLWDSWSKNSSKYIKNECKNKWTTFTNDNNGLNVGSLIMWAKNDNPSFEIKNYPLIETNNNDLFMHRINRYYLRENSGLRDLFYDLVKDTIVITTNDGDGYIYDDKLKLWLFKTKNYLCDLVLLYLEPSIENDITIIENFIKKSLKEEKINYETIFKNVKNKLKYVRNLNNAKSIFTGSISYLQDFTFIKLLNSIPDFLPIKNQKKINLTNGEITERNKFDYFSFECDVEYVNERKHINKFMKSVFIDEEKRKYVQTIYGYCLTGQTRERCLFIEYGKGSNGKSVLNIILSKILGIDKFFVQAQKDLFVKNKKNYASASPHLYQLINARVAIFSETEENDRLNDGDIKSITGNNSITCRPLYGQNITFTPICKLILETNHLLEFNHNDLPIIDRLKYIHFDQRFVNVPKNKNEHKRDPIFIELLYTTYLNECFSFFVDGAIQWYKNGLLVPEHIQIETKNYINNMDTVQTFYNEFIQNNTNNKIKCSELYSSYRQFSENKQFIKIVKSVEFKKNMVDKYNFFITNIHGVEYYRDIIFSL